MLHHKTYHDGMSIECLLVEHELNYRNKKLLEACRQLECQLCGAEDGTVCAAHSNWQGDGKGMGIKASDAAVASLCHKCHMEIDQGHTMPKAAKFDQWNFAHRKTMRALIERGILVVK